MWKWNPFLALLAMFCLLGTSSSTQPHIVMVLVDDWGWANVGYHAKDDPDMVRATKNIDALCDSGLELDQFYTHSVCGPTRASLLSGRLPMNVNVDNGYVTMYNPSNPSAGGVGIPPNMTTISEKLHSAGYATHVVGKWDVGMATSAQAPKARDFNSSLVYFSHWNDMYTMEQGKCHGSPIKDFWENDQPAHNLAGAAYEEEIFNGKLLDIINTHNPDIPLFLYYPSRVAHIELQAPEEYEDRFSDVEPKDRRLYYAMVNYLDDVVGSITDALERKGMWDNTLFVMTSDNGGELNDEVKGGANNYPLRGGKETNWQGGIRVNGFVAGGALPPAMRGETLDEYIHVCDWYATFCHLAGVPKFDLRAARAGLRSVDSLNMWPLLSGETTTSPRTEFFLAPQVYDGSVRPKSGYGLIQGDFKILLDENKLAGWTSPIFPNGSDVKFPTKFCCPDVGCLFNIKDDPYEYDDLSEDPDLQQKLASMRDTAKEYYENMYTPDRGNKPNEEACNYATDPQIYNGFWGPFVIDDNS